MKTFLINLVLIFALTSCTNTSELETGEMKTLHMLKKAFEGKKHSKTFIDAKALLSREQIDEANIPVLFVKLKSGQNGTLTPYPGQGIGQTWLGADGATVTMYQGVLTATRGMGNDLIGSSSSMPEWSKIGYDERSYKRELSYISGNNRIVKHSFECNIKKNKQKELIKIWELSFFVTVFEENCDSNGFEIRNTFYLDEQKIVRRSTQFHSNTVGYILTERLDRY